MTNVAGGRTRLRTANHSHTSGALRRWQVASCGAALVIAAATVACTSSDPEQTSGDVTTEQPTTTPVSTGTGISTTPTTELFPDTDPGPCTGGFPYDQTAPAYQGPGPHLIAPADVRAIDLEAVKEDTDEVKSAGIIRFIPGSWLAEPPPIGETGIRTGSQLLVCFLPILTPDAAPVGRCEVGGAGFDVVPAVYNFAVYESRTGDSVDTFTLPGTAPAEESCPSSMTYTYSTKVAQGVDERALVERLRPLVEGPA